MAAQALSRGEAAFPVRYLAAMAFPASNTSNKEQPNTTVFTFRKAWHTAKRGQDCLTKQHGAESVTIENSSVIDFLGLERSTGAVVLTITDHLDWSNSEVHMQMLQEKVQAYLHYIESNQLAEDIADWRERPIRIDVFARFDPQAIALQILESFSLLSGVTITVTRG